jgi:hypothetical protein
MEAQTVTHATLDQLQMGMELRSILLTLLSMHPCQMVITKPTPIKKEIGKILDFFFQCKNSTSFAIFLLNFTKKINTNGEERKKKNCIRQIQADK